MAPRSDASSPCSSALLAAGRLGSHVLDHIRSPSKSCAHVLANKQATRRDGTKAKSGNGPIGLRREHMAVKTWREQRSSRQAGERFSSRSAILSNVCRMLRSLARAIFRALRLVSTPSWVISHVSLTRTPLSAGRIS
jgi:hypothetical protein